MKPTVCLLFSLNVPVCTLHNTSRTQKTALAAKNSGFQIIRKAIEVHVMLFLDGEKKSNLIISY